MKTKKRSAFAGKVGANAKHQKEARSSYGYLKLPKGVNIFNPKPGSRVRLDFLPYVVSDKNHPDRNEELGIATPGSLWYRRPFRSHRNIGSENQSVICLTSVGRKCPICDFRSQRMKEGAEKEETDGLKYSQRNLYCVTPIDDRDNEEKPHIWDVSQFLFQNLLNDELEEDERFELFPDPEEGYTLRIRFDERSFAGNKFAEASRIDFVERKKPYTEADLAKVPDLDQVLSILTPKELEKMFLELDDADIADNDKPASKQDDDDDATPPRRRERDDNDDDDDKPVRGKQKEEDDEEDSPPRRRAAETDDDDDVPEKLASRRRRDDDDDEDEPPQRRRPPKEEEDDDDQDDDDQDEKEASKEKEEDPPPKSKRESKSNGNECPSGYVFGKDTDEYDECDKCPVWEKCLDAKEARKAR